MKNIIKNVSKNQTFKIEENERIINIVERILCFNQLNQEKKGLKINTKSNAQQITNFLSPIKGRK